MEKIKEAALSKIADILSDNEKSPIIPKVDVWKMIFNNAEQNELYESMEPQFLTIAKRIDWNDTKYFHNPKLYNALNSSFIELLQNSGELVKLLNNIAYKFLWTRLFDFEKIERLKRKENKYINKSEEEFFYQVCCEKTHKYFKDCSLKTYNVLKDNLNILGLEMSWQEDSFCIQHFTERILETKSDIDMVSQWLDRNYPEVFESYINAKKAYSNGDCVGSVVHCRNIITGIFSTNKEEGYEWFSGLQKICADDKNILTIKSPKQIPNIKYNEYSTKKDEKYRYPRFNFLYKLYVMTCALGAHANEGPLENGVINAEKTSMEDALWILRSTENFLIWLIQRDNLQ